MHKLQTNKTRNNKTAGNTAWFGHRVQWLQSVCAWGIGMAEPTCEARGSTQQPRSSVVIIAFHHLGDCIALCSIICFRTEVSVFVHQFNMVRKYSCVLFLSLLKTWERGYSLPFLTLPEITIVEICMTFMLPL